MLRKLLKYEFIFLIKDFSRIYIIYGIQLQHSKNVFGAAAFTFLSLRLRCERCGQRRLLCPHHE